MAREVKAGKDYIDPDDDVILMGADDCLRFAALVAAAERERMAAQLIRIGDGYGVRDVGLDEATYTRMQQTAYEHANVILTNGCNHSSPSPETVRILRARGEQ